MKDAEVWELERRLWLEGEDAYDALMSADCIMAFPPPVGILSGATIKDSLENAPRWSAVEVMEQTAVYPDETTVILAYRAESCRGEETYHAYCTSTYRRLEDGWRIVQHQQTPI